MKSELPPCASVSMHTHESATLVLLLAGEYRETFRGSTDSYAPMTLIVKPAGERHANEIGAAGARCLVIEVPDDKARELTEAIRPCEAPRAYSRAPATFLALRIAHRVGRHDAVGQLDLETDTLHLLESLSPQPLASDPSRSAPEWVNWIVDVLHSAAAPPSLTELAAGAGVHPVHLARVFRRAKGCSIGEFARNLQVERAVRMLARSRTPLADIALAAGFYDQSHMGKVVKGHTGLSASQIRTVIQA